MVGDQVLYRRGNTWYSYDVAQAAAQPGANVKVIERFSDEYFRLVQETTHDNQRILAAQRDQEEVIIQTTCRSSRHARRNLSGQVMGCCHVPHRARPLCRSIYLDVLPGPSTTPASKSVKRSASARPASVRQRLLFGVYNSAFA